MISYHVFSEFLATNAEHSEALKNQYTELLSQLTSTPDISVELFTANIDKIHSMGRIVIATVGSFDNSDLKIVGSGTVIIEPKIIRGGKSVGHIEDIVISSAHRGAGIAQEILNQLKDYSVRSNCYKVILDCDEAVQGVYEKNGFVVKGLQMGVYM